MELGKKDKEKIITRKITETMPNRLYNLCNHMQITSISSLNTYDLTISFLSKEIQITTYLSNKWWSVKWAKA